MNTKMYNEIKEEPEIVASLENENKAVLTELASIVNDRKITNGLFAGRGTSDHACIYAQYALGSETGIVAALGCPSILTLYNAKPDLKDYLTLGISQSGRAEDVKSYLIRSKESGGVSASITNYKDSPLAQNSDFHLFLNCGEEKSVAATKTFTAQLSLIALLTAYISGNKEIIDSYNKVPEALSKLFIKCDEEIEKYAIDFKAAEEAFVLSRGLTYPLALETRLKMQETCYMKVQGYASSDFYHGPLAQVDENSKVIIYASKGCAFKDNVAIAEKIRGIGCDPLIVTNDNNLTSEFKKCFVVPETGNEITDTIVYTMFAQRLAEKICSLKGLNPDSPRNLHKVTITK